MPEVFFTIELPDGRQHQCYSPSTVIHEHFRFDDRFPMKEFVARSRVAFAAASERVRARYGYACSSAASQLEEIEGFSHRYAPDEVVRIVSI